MIQSAWQKAKCENWDQISQPWQKLKSKFWKHILRNSRFKDRDITDSHYWHRTYILIFIYFKLNWEKILCMRKWSNPEGLVLCDFLGYHKSCWLLNLLMDCEPGKSEFWPLCLRFLGLISEALGQRLFWPIALHCSGQSDHTVYLCSNVFKFHNCS